MIPHHRETTAAPAGCRRPGAILSLALAILLAGCAGQSQPARTGAQSAPEIVPPAGDQAEVARRLETLQALRDRGLLDNARYRQWRTRLQSALTD